MQSSQCETHTPSWAFNLQCITHMTCKYKGGSERKTSEGPLCTRIFLLGFKLVGIAGVCSKGPKRDFHLRFCVASLRTVITIWKLHIAHCHSHDWQTTAKHIPYTIRVYVCVYEACIQSVIFGIYGHWCLL